MDNIISDIPYTIYKDECGYCFKNEKNLIGEDTNNFLYFCLQCYQSFCSDDLHFHEKAAPDHRLYLKYTRKEKKLQEETESKLKKVKLEIQNDPSIDEKFDLEWLIIKKDNNINDANVILKYDEEANSENHKIFDWINSIFDKKSIEYQEKDQQWKLEVKSCEHTKNVETSLKVTDLVFNKNNVKCNDCEINENLWLCLHCGNLGCGRNQPGIKGNSHALEHQKSNSSHSLVLKLGSFSDSNQDIYCYSCDDEVKLSNDFKPEFITLLSKVGISSENFATEKGLAELNIEQNLNWDFKLTDTSGQDLKSVKPNRIVGTGLMNLGNSCYFNAVIQSLFNDGISVEKFDLLKDSDAYNTLLTDVVYPNSNIKVQLKKLINAIQNNPEEYAHGVKPLLIKKMTCQGNEEFSSGRQQDAMEFLIYFLNVLENKILPKNDETLNKLFKFDTVNKMKCTACKKYKEVETPGEAFVNVPLNENLTEQNLSDKFYQIFNETDIGFKCPECDSAMSSKTEFKSYPETLIVNPTRIKLENWVPVKTCSKLAVPETIDLSYLDYKEVDPKNVVHEGPKKFVAKEELINQLIEFGGFTRNACIRALKVNDNNDNIELSLNWIFDHIEDDDINEPLKEEDEGLKGVDQESLSMMMSMGLSEKLCIKGLTLKNGKMEQAIDWVFNNMDDNGELDAAPTKAQVSSGNKYLNEPKKYALQSVICHKGNSVHSGHYVAFIKKVIDSSAAWVLYNDEKIIKLEETNPNKIEDIGVNGYIYIYKKI